MVQARRVGRCGSRFRAAGEEPDDSSPLPDDREGEGKSFTKLGWYREVLTFAPMSGRGSVFLEVVMKCRVLSMEQDPRWEQYRLFSG